MLKTFALLALIFAPSFADAGLIAQYKLEQNFSDSVGSYNGSAVGTGGIFGYAGPVASQGKYCWNANNAGYVSLPNSVLTNLFSSSGSKTGSIQVDFILGGQEYFGYTAGYSPLVSWKVNGGENTVYAVDTTDLPKITLAAWNTTTRVVTDSLNYCWNFARWATVTVDWTPTGYNVYILDSITGASSKIISMDPYTGTPLFGTVSDVRIGSADTVGYSRMWIDNVRVYDAPTGGASLPEKRGYSIINYGSSHVQGTECGNGSLRDGFLAQGQKKIFPNGYYFNGTQYRYNVAGLYTEKNWCPFQEGYSGMTSAWTDAGYKFITDEQKLTFNGNYGTDGGARLIYSMGPFGGDAIAAITSSTAKAQMDAMCNTAWARAPNALIVINNISAMPGNAPWDAGVAACNAGYAASYSAFKAAGKKVLYADWFAINPELCADGVHPDDNGYYSVGVMLYNLINSYLYPEYTNIKLVPRNQIFNVPFGQLSAP